MASAEPVPTPLLVKIDDGDSPNYDMISMAIGVSVLIFVISDFWLRRIPVLIRFLRIKLRPKEGTCDYLKWSELLGPYRNESDRTLLHLCNGTWFHHAHHQPGSECWKSIDAFFDTSQLRRTWIEKPQDLDIGKDYLCIDKEVLLAFLMCNMNAQFVLGPIHRRLLEVNLGPVRLKVEENQTTFMKGNSAYRRTTVIHLSYHLIDSDMSLTFHNLTVQELDRMINHGYPPYYRQRLMYDGQPLRESLMIPSPEHLKRGGWIIAIGFLSLTPVPVYMDTVREGRGVVERGTVFWRSVKRVREVIEKNFLRIAGLDEDDIEDIQAIINALQHIEREMSNSGAEGCLKGDKAQRGIRVICRVEPSKLHDRLSAEQVTKAIEIFNDMDSRNLTDKGVVQLGIDVKPMLLQVLQAAFLGARTVAEYAKNPGRELNDMLPSALDNVDRVFLTGCSDIL